MRKFITLENGRLALKKQSAPIYERFTLPKVPPGTEQTTIVLQKKVCISAPITVVHNSLQQILGADFLVEDNKIQWINSRDPLDEGILEVSYWEDDVVQ